MDTPEEIDALLEAEKVIAGRPAWSKSRETTVRIKLPLQIGEAIVSGLFLAGTASIYNSPQDGSLLLLYHGQVIERMNVFPTAPHANPFDKRLSPQLRGLTLQAFQHRYHAWARNRAWPRPATDNLAVAEFIDRDLAKFAEAVQYFMERVHVRGTMPLPPHEPRLPL